MRAALIRIAACAALYYGAVAVSLSEGPQNVIVLIGDGMGFEQVSAAGMYAYGAPGTFSFESFPHQTEVMTYSANSSITDSAAAATAIATGHKVNNGVISMAIPGDGSELETMLEYFADRGRSTGLVTTTYITHATPAAFGAHEPSRNNLWQIAGDYLNQTRPNVIFGGGRNGMTVSRATAAGYTVVTDRAEMQALDPDAVTLASGQFGTTHLPYEYDYFIGIDDGYDTLPHLSEMTTTVLDILDADPDGFFLMVEGGRIDHAGHANNIQRNVFETIEFAGAVQEAIDWAAGHDDTLILVTADHETGGLTVLQNNGQGNFPTVSWSTTGHTGVNVPIYAWGVNAELVYGEMDNTDLFNVVTIPEPATLALLPLLFTILSRRRNERRVKLASGARS
ncbi:MAG: alkaline phosphatase [Phycisphaerae bacterium]